MKIGEEKRDQPAWLSDHPVLEFLNTTSIVEGILVDRLQSNANVLSILVHLGWPVPTRAPGLLAAARELREEIRSLIERRKAGKPLDLERLNTFLGLAKSHLKLNQDRRGSLAVSRDWECATAQQALAPVAEAAADMLAGEDFNLIRRCESEACVLWFYDRTKSHRRRWCSMDTCGNRHKVAAFRKRRSEARG